MVKGAGKVISEATGGGVGDQRKKSPRKWALAFPRKRRQIPAYPVPGAGQANVTTSGVH
jgi:hypothetical protein